VSLADGFAGGAVASPALSLEPPSSPAGLEAACRLLRQNTRLVLQRIVCLIASPYCSFIKTELVQKNPGRVPNVERLWKSLVPENAPCGMDILEAHLAASNRPVARYRGPSWWRPN
jgi:hypothetical protein